jgi:hypothetical protein
MALSTPGIGSGLDISGIVDKLMAIEQAPLSKINTNLVGLQAQVSAYGSLKSAVSSFRDAVSALADASKFKVINEAYETLSDDHRRKQYDRELHPQDLNLFDMMFGDSFMMPGMPPHVNVMFQQILT